MNLPLKGDFQVTGLINVPTNKLFDHKRFDENIPEREDITRARISLEVPLPAVFSCNSSFAKIFAAPSARPKIGTSAERLFDYSRWFPISKIFAAPSALPEKTD